MPNWCENRLTIEGPTAELERFREETTGSSEFDFETILPTPPELMTEGRDGWFDWRTSAAGWGTKWAVDIDDFACSENLLEYWFHSAWSPPEGIVRQLGGMYPLLKFRISYAEGGNGFAGCLQVQGFDVIENLECDGEEAVAFVKREFGYDWMGWDEEE